MLYIILIIFVFVPLLYLLDGLFFSDKRKEISVEIYKPNLDKYKKESKPALHRKLKNETKAQQEARRRKERKQMAELRTERLRKE